MAIRPQKNDRIVPRDINVVYCQYLHNVKRMRSYQRGRAWITGLVFQLRQIIETERLVRVVMARLVSFIIFGLARQLDDS
ncbi:MAG: hypothetical protein RL346_889 [Verrucomicrobiota bacterium]